MPTLTYTDDIIIYPITGNLADITNTDVTTSHAIYIKVFNLVANTSLAIYNPLQNKQNFFDNTDNDATEWILTDESNDTTITSYQTIDYTLKTETLESVQFKAYLYDATNKVSIEYIKNLQVTYNFVIDIVGINVDLDATDYSLDGTIFINGQVTVPADTFLLIDEVTGNSNKYIPTSSQPEQLTGKFRQLLVTETTPNTIFTIHHDSSDVRPITTALRYTLYDITNRQISQTQLNSFTTKRPTCIIPPMEIYTSTPTVSLGYDISGGGAPNTFTSTMFSLNRHKINYVKLTDPNVQDSSWPRFYKNYINVPYATTYIEPSKTIELNARMLSTGQDASLGELIIQDTTSTKVIKDVGQVPNLNIINADDTSSNWLVFTAPNLPSYSKLNAPVWLLYKFENCIYNSRGSFKLDNDIVETDFDFGCAVCNKISSPVYNYPEFDSTVGEENYIYYNAYNVQNIPNQQPQYKYTMMVDINTAKLSSHIVTISNLYMPNNQIIGGSPFMFKCDTQEKIKIQVTANRCSVKKAGTLEDRSVITTIVEPGTPFELPLSNEQIDFYKANENDPPIITIYFEYLEFSEGDQYRESRVSFQLSPIFDDNIYVYKNNEFNPNIGEWGATAPDTTIAYCTFVGGNNPQLTHCYTPRKIMGISGIRHTDLTQSSTFTSVHTQYPTTIFDRKMSDWGDVEFTMSPFLGTPTGSTLSTLRVRVYEKDTTVTDQTDISGLDVGDIVHVFGFLANKTFIMEYNVIPDDTSIVSYSDPEKITFTTVAGKCNAPSITQNTTSGIATIQCDSTCRPAFNITTDSYPLGSSGFMVAPKDQQLNWSTYIKILQHPDNNITYYVQSNTNTVYAGIASNADYQRYYNPMQHFVCIGYSSWTPVSSIGVDYSSDDATVPMVYPTQSVYPPYLTSHGVGSSSQRIYRYNYYNGSQVGSLNAAIQYKKNGGSWVNGGTGSYINVAMNISDTIEIQQRDQNAFYGNSQIISGKRYS